LKQEPRTSQPPNFPASGVAGLAKPAGGKLGGVKRSDVAKN